MRRSDFVISVLLHVGLLSLIIIVSSARSGASQFDPDELVNVEILDQLPMGGGPSAQQQPESEPEPEPEEVPLPDMPTEMATDVQEEEPVKLASITEPAEIEVENIKEKKPVTKPKEKPKPKPKQTEAKPKEKSDSEKSSDEQKTVIGEGEIKTSIGVGTGAGAGGVGDFPYDIRRAVQLIDRNWDNPILSQKSLRCTVYFQIDRNGGIKGATVEESSGHSQFDMYALAAVMRTSELPPLPASYRYDVLGFHLEFEYKP